MDAPATLTGFQWVVITVLSGVVSTLAYYIHQLIKENKDQAKGQADQVIAMNREYVEVATALQVTLKDLRGVIESGATRLERIERRILDETKRQGAA